MTARLCNHAGCTRPDPSSSRGRCTIHDDQDYGPGICECPTPQPDTGWGQQCTICWHPIINLHPHLAPAIGRWPELAYQQVVDEEQVA